MLGSDGLEGLSCLWRNASSRIESSVEFSRNCPGAGSPMRLSEGQLFNVTKTNRAI